MDKVTTVTVFLLASTWAQTPDTSTTQKPICYRGWTGEDSGGSCSFDQRSLCDWSNVKGDDMKWKLTRRGLIKLTPSWTSSSEMGRLRSPPLCQYPVSESCLKVKLRFSSGGGSQIYAQYCGVQRKCEMLFHHIYDGSTSWIEEAVTFNATGMFEIIIVGDKFNNTSYGGESDMYIDYIQYINLSCDEAVKGVTSPSSTTEADGGGPQTDKTIDVERTDHDKKGDDKDNSTIVIISVSAVLVIVLVVAVIVTVLLVRRRRNMAPPGKTIPQTDGGARYERNESIVMVTNELYTRMDQLPTLRFEDTDTPREQGRQSTPVKQHERIMGAGEIANKKRPTSSPSRVITSDNDTKKQARENSPTRKTSTDSNEMYENTINKITDDKLIYENTDRSCEKGKSVYENTTPRDSEPGVKEGGADGTYEKMQIESSTEYSHLIDPNQRPDRRQDNYDHIDD